MAEEPETNKSPASSVGRVSRSLLGGRWPEFFVEFVLIIVGILVALAIDGWMQDARDRKTETAYLQLLRDDLVQIESELQSYADFEKSNLELGAHGIHAISEDNLPGDPQVLRKAISSLGSRRTLAVASAAYADLTSTGNLQLIRDTGLRTRIVQYFAAIDRIEVVVEKNNSAFIDRLFYPFLLDTGVTIDLNPPVAVVRQANKFVREALGPNFKLPTDDVLAQPSSAESWDDLRRNMLFRMLISGVGVALGESAIQSTRELRANIEEELRNQI